MLLKNNENYPWFILVPKRNHITELHQLSAGDRWQLMDEMSALSAFVETHYQPDKLNTGALGNIVTQLHIHIIGRYKSDPTWPHGVWQAGQQEKPYSEVGFLIGQLKKLIVNHTN